jgi:type II secretory pathway component PulJ
MQLLRSSLPMVLEMDYLDANVLHLALHEYKDLLKRKRAIRRKKELYERLNRMIALVDLMI